MKIYRGKQTPEHKGDTSRELLSMWEESGYCEVIDGEVEDVFIWANAPGDVLLYEYDRWDVYPGTPPAWRKALFGGQQHPRGEPWIYWGRRPKILHAKVEQGIMRYADRTIESLFLGKVENSIQLKNRTFHDWSDSVSFFSMPVQMGDSFNWKYTQEEYLDFVSKSKFGLCLPGYGPKCNREIEYLALGVVPIMTDGVDTIYNDPLIEGFHYFQVKSPLEIAYTIQNCSKDRWEYMSYNCRQWYEKNCSPRGSFETTQRLTK